LDGTKGLICMKKCRNMLIFFAGDGASPSKI